MTPRVTSHVALLRAPALPPLSRLTSLRSYRASRKVRPIGSGSSFWLACRGSTLSSTGFEPLGTTLTVLLSCVPLAPPGVLMVWTLTRLLAFLVRGLLF